MITRQSLLSLAVIGLSIFGLIKSAQTQTLSGVRIGDTVAQAIDIVGMKPSKVYKMGPFKIVAWDFPNGNIVLVTDRQNRICRIGLGWSR